MPAQHLTTDATVYDTVGEKGGMLHRYEQRGGYLVVRRGVSFRTDIYIPLYAFGGPMPRGTCAWGTSAGTIRR